MPFIKITYETKGPWEEVSATEELTYEGANYDLVQVGVHGITIYDCPKRLNANFIPWSRIWAVRERANG